METGIGDREGKKWRGGGREVPIMVGEREERAGEMEEGEGEREVPNKKRDRGEERRRKGGTH